jgi:hypothetical protein
MHCLWGKGLTDEKYVHPRKRFRRVGIKKRLVPINVNYFCPVSNDNEINGIQLSLACVKKKMGRFKRGYLRGNKCTISTREVIPRGYKCTMSIREVIPRGFKCTISIRGYSKRV